MLRSGGSLVGSGLMGLGMIGSWRELRQKNNDKIFEFKSIKPANFTSKNLDSKD
jgi:hypothetical protein